MYLVSVNEDQPVIEASMGGRIDVVEMRTLAEELEETLEEWNGKSFYLLLDYSKAIDFDERTTSVLNALKDRALALGAAKIFSVPQEDTDLEDHVAARMQHVLEGREEYLLVASQAEFAPLPAQRTAKAA